MSHDHPQPAEPGPPPIPLVRSNPRATWTVTAAGTPVPDGYPEMIARLRLLLDRVAAAAPSPGLVDDIARHAGQLNARLLAAAVPESGQVAGQLVTLPGRAQLLVPPYQVDQLDNESMGGRVRTSWGGWPRQAEGRGPALPTCTSTTGPLPPSRPACRSKPGSRRKRDANASCTASCETAAGSVPRQPACSSRSARDSPSGSDHLVPGWVPGPARGLPGPAGRRVILVDSDVLTEHLRGRAPARDWLVQRFEVTGQVAWRAATLMQEYHRSRSGVGLGDY